MTGFDATPLAAASMTYSTPAYNQVGLITAIAKFNITPSSAFPIGS
jgi:hypothetical protein